MPGNNSTAVDGITHQNPHSPTNSESLASQLTPQYSSRIGQHRAWPPCAAGTAWPAMHAVMPTAQNRTAVAVEGPKDIHDACAGRLQRQAPSHLEHSQGSQQALAHWHNACCITTMHPCSEVTALAAGGGLTRFRPGKSQTAEAPVCSQAADYQISSGKRDTRIAST